MLSALYELAGGLLLGAALALVVATLTHPPEPPVTACTDGSLRLGPAGGWECTDGTWTRRPDLDTNHGPAVDETET
jgi:hypothetical protein